jgi:hypothetical protein
MMHRRPPSPGRFAALMILVACAACAHVPQQSESLKQANVEATTAELRTRTVELGRHLIREIEVACDSIDAGTTDSRVRRNTLLLRMSTLAGMTEAVLREDPVIAMLDLYGFKDQLANFMASPLATESFGPGVACPQRAIDRFARRWETVASDAGATIKEENRAKVEGWARDYPIDRLPFTRSSLTGALAIRLRDDAGGIGAAVGGIQATLDRLEHRASLANEYAIKEGMWLSQFAALSVGGTPEASELTRTLRDSQALMQDTPGLVDRARLLTLLEVNRQRLETLATVAQERAILLQAVASERATVLLAVSEERRQVMRDVDSLRTRVVADEMRMIDHLVLRLAELLGVSLLLGLLGLAVVRRRAVPA